MSRAHEGVPVAQLPGTELVAYLLAQPPPGADRGCGVAAGEPGRAGGQRGAHARDGS